jgi:hypothetical protein
VKEGAADSCSEVFWEKKLIFRAALPTRTGLALAMRSEYRNQGLRFLKYHY